MKRSPRSSSAGSALLITIFFLTIITVVAIGFMSSARVERASARSHFERMRATELARNGIERAVGLLQKETAYRFLATGPDGVERYYYRNYVTQPGALIVPEVPGFGTSPALTQSLLTKIKYLSTQLPAVNSHKEAVFNAPDLNIETFDKDDGKPTHLITDLQEGETSSSTGTSTKAISMKLKWLYIRQNKNGSTDPTKWTEEEDDGGSSEEPTISKGSPIIGRYAYWADDESSKVNYNLAWKRKDNPNRASHPSRINLTAMGLTDAMADVIHNYTIGTTAVPGRFYNSFADARYVGASNPTLASDISDFLNKNKFDLTHYNHDPDTTFFGEDRILLTTNRDLVPSTLDPVTKKQKYARKFLDIMRDDKAASTLDPGKLLDIAAGQSDFTVDSTGATLVQNGNNKFDAVVRMLIRYISERNWPLTQNISFKDKFYPGSTDSEARIAQLAVNIIDYVRSKESAETTFAPTRFALGTDGKYTMKQSVSYGGDKSYQGVTRAPYITESGFYVEKISRKMPYDMDIAPPGWPTEQDPDYPTDPKKTRPIAMYPVKVKYEIYLPTRYMIPGGIDLVPWTNDPKLWPTPPLEKEQYAWFLLSTAIHGNDEDLYYVYSAANKKMVNVKSHSNSCIPITLDMITDGEGTKKSILMPGKYITVTQTLYRTKSYAQAKQIKLCRVALFHGNPGTDGLLSEPFNQWTRINIGPQYDESDNFKLDDPAVTEEKNMSSFETDDPRCNTAALDWLPQRTKNTFGAQNGRSTLDSTSYMAKPSYWPKGKPFPQQDTDKDGKLTDYSVFMPPPKGKIYTDTVTGITFDNSETGDAGRVRSIAELGYVCTGNEAKSDLYSTPWRTVRLQPTRETVTVGLPTILPDWAFMDLFGVPNISKASAATAASSSESRDIYTPHNSSVGGRVNVNSHVDPFTTMNRTGGLVAALTGANGLSVADAKTLANNIYLRTLASGTSEAGPNNGRVYGFPATNNVNNPGPDEPNAYDTPSEICEIKGVADTGEKSEDLVRDVASVITARGNVFSIYTIGQSLSQTPAGKLVVTGEQRQQAMVERYVETRNTLDTADDEVRFRTVYFRNLSP